MVECELAGRRHVIAGQRLGTLKGRDVASGGRQWLAGFWCNRELEVGEAMQA